MIQFKAIPEKWRNSLRIKFPLEVIKKENIKPGKKINVVIIGNPHKKTIIKNAKT